MSVIMLVALFMPLAGMAPLHAAPPQEGATAPQEEEAPSHAVAGSVSLEIPPGARASASFDVDRAIEAWIGTMSAEQRERSDAYFEGGYWLQLWGLLYGIGVGCLLLATRWSAKMRDLAERLTRRRPLQTALYAVQYLLIGTVLSFPLSVYQGFLREHQYGLATQTFGGWMGDQTKGLLIGLIMMPLLLTLLYGVVRRLPRTWWVWGSVVTVGFLMFITTIGPVFISPVFNDYQALEEGPVRDSILSLARASGVPADDVYWFDASRQTTRISANVSGMFGTTRISLNDNLLYRSSPEEIEVVMGHEMGHYVLNHSAKLITYFGLVIILGFGFIRLSFDYALKRWGGSWGVRGIGDVAGLPLVLMLFALYGFAMTPVTNSIVRITEQEADIFGVNASRQPDGFASTAVKLSEYRKMVPGPLEEILFYDHPSGYQRIKTAMRWKAENLDAAAESGH